MYMFFTRRVQPVDEPEAGDRREAAAALQHAAEEDRAGHEGVYNVPYIFLTLFFF